MNAVKQESLALQRLYHWERTAPGRIALSQPMGGGVVRDFTWAQVARRGTTHGRPLESPGLGARLEGGHPVQELRLVADEPSPVPTWASRWRC